MTNSSSHFKTKFDRSTTCFLHSACFPPKNIAKNCKFWEKSVFWCSFEIKKHSTPLYEWLWQTFQVMPKSYDQLHGFSSLKRQSKIVPKTQEFKPQIAKITMDNVFLENLPNEIWCHVFLKLPIESKKNATATCR